MGIQVIVYGYIEFSHDKEEKFITLLDEVSSEKFLSFFSIKPFSNVVEGYRNSMVSFVASEKNIEWRLLDKSFETFLYSVNSFISASIVFEVEDNKSIKVDYVFDGELINRIE